MSRITPFNQRTSFLLSSDRLLATLQRTQLDLQRAQEQISTGKLVNRPSDAPSKISAMLLLREQQRLREQTDRNLQHSLNALDSIDAALGDATGILLEAKNVALEQANITSNTAERKAQANVIDGNIRALLDIANRQFQGISLFGGNNSATRGGLVFEEFLGGIRYTGATANLNADVGLNSVQPFTSNGLEVFGSLSSRVTSQVDLNPQAVAATRLRDLGGAQAAAVRPGAVMVNVNGTQTVVDLTDADTLGDVQLRLNEAIQAIDPAAQLNIVPNGFELFGGASTVTISDIGGGQMAADLGIALTAAPAATAAGADVHPRLTRQTQLTDLGASVDFASGLLITQGQVTKVADFSAAQTVEDLMNVVDRLGLGVRLEINSQGDGLNLISEVSGLQLSVGENGGSTAGDLGLRTFGLDTRLDQMNLGLGVRGIEGEADFRIELHSGDAFEVNLDGITTVGQLIAEIEAQALAAGVPAGDFVVGLAANGNGLVLTDNTVGGGEFRVRHVGQSLAAEHLGIYANAGGGNTIAGQDVAKVQVDSIFTDLMDLRNALLQDDTRGITLAGEKIETDLDHLAESRAIVGVRAKRVEDAQRRSQDMDVLEKTLLGNLEEADLTEVITRYSQLTMQLEAALRIGSSNLQVSLLDFLR